MSKIIENHKACLKNRVAFKEQELLSKFSFCKSLFFNQIYLTYNFLESLRSNMCVDISCSDNKGLISITARSRNQETDSTGNCEIEVARKCWFLERKNQRFY